MRARDHTGCSPAPPAGTFFGNFSGMANDARVLIIEDNDALRVMLFTVLRHQPLQVDTAADVDAAMEKVTTCDYALILIDMNLPNDTANLFLRRFQVERAGIQTFIIGVKDPVTEQTPEAGIVSALLNKPLEIDTLAEVVRECALVVPPPDDPLPCAPAESELRMTFDRGGSSFAN